MVFRHAYFIYKKTIEAGTIHNLRPFVRPGTWVMDIGANIGFFSIYFSDWISRGGKVIALEPEARNYSLLCRTTRKQQQAGRLETLQVAADSKDGTSSLTINPFHPGDHKLGDHGTVITTVTIDSVLEDRGNPVVSLIKIDVQGAEMRVLEGGGKTLQQHRPALWIEIDDAALRSFGTSAEDIFSFLHDRGYKPYEIITNGPPEPVDMDRVKEITRKRKYTDILFLPAAQLHDNMIRPEELQ